MAQFHSSPFNSSPFNSLHFNSGGRLSLMETEAMPLVRLRTFATGQEDPPTGAFLLREG